MARGDRGEVSGLVVGGVVVPAAPDDPEPGAGQDPDGVGVVQPASSGPGVGVLGPGVSGAAAVGEVNDSLAQAVVAAAAEGDVVGPARRPGGRGDAGRGGEGVVGGEAGADVADLGEQGRGPDGPGAGKAGEHRLIGVRVKRCGDVGIERVNPLPQAPQQRDLFAGDQFGGVGGRAVGQAGGCVSQVAVQLGRGAGGRAGVVGGVEPGGEALLGEPAGVARGREAGQERQGDLPVELVEQPALCRTNTGMVAEPIEAA